MHIKINEDYNVVVNTALLGYVGETNARSVTVEGMEIDGADRYVLTIDYGDGTVYEVDITGGQWTPTADVLRSAQTVSCQICAKKLSGNEYILVKKSRIFRLRIGAAIDDTAIPSPDVSMDALDRIDSIGRQAHADMQTAVTAADTATTAAENAKKSATAAEQAASRAETAKTSAETSATQADTARQGAETARQQAVTAQNAAKVSAAQASASAQQTEADKTITAGYAKTAKTCADSTTADRQAVQTLAEQVTADKANVAENATKVAEDRAAAETAAQTAQSIADSLPDDYVTAVGKIAENTAEIANVKLTDKELQRRVNALYDLGNGITHQFETDSETAYAKTVPTGAKLMSVKSVGGRSIVFNQFAKNKPFDSRNGITTSTDGNYSVLDGTATNAITAKGWWGLKLDEFSPTNGHKYLFCSKIISGTVNPANGCTIGTAIQKQIVGKSFIFEMSDKHWDSNWLSAIYSDKDTVFNKLKFSVMLIDLTAMFGSNNEPASVEEFEKMFPNDYYPYNAGEIVSASTESVMQQGKNLFDYTDKIYYGANASKVENGIVYTKGLTTTVLNIPTIIGNKYTLSFKVKSNTANQGGLRWSLQKGKNISYAHDSSLIKLEVGYAANTEYQAVATFVATTDFVSLCTIMPMVYDVQLENGDTATGYSPFYQTEHTIPEAIRNLPGYGWSAGTAKNWVDYENKKYYQCVQSVDLGTLNWNFNTTSGVGNHFYGRIDPAKFKYLGAFGTTVYNVLCSKYRTVSRSSSVFVDKTITIDGVNTTVSQIQIKDTAYTNAAAFKQAMQGVMLYYELANPIITDISDLIPDDFLRNLTVKAGGSVTFKNRNDSYRIPVPSEEEYVVKLSEVGGSI
ncbi:hypothetical protein [uncultured Ruminococcus sp.]|jgi:hypothetical protein|uniref:hypothetical protein n=1 Tax=uncultured Ruminococcus sp. TaxID=165186 RepID=UPI00259228A0|nr:hypothetical protein [uncultured Ruminococcus sp.]